MRPFGVAALPASLLVVDGRVAATNLRGERLEPVLVGGMAMVTIGSRRVTRDFDFVIAHPEDRVQDIAFLEARQKAT